MEILSAAYRRHAIIIVMIFVICILIECLICNANAFRLKNNGDYKQKTYTLQDLKITNAEVDMDNGKIIYNYNVPYKVDTARGRDCLKC